MMIGKRFFSLLLTGVLMASLAACGGSAASQKTTEAAAQKKETEAAKADEKKSEVKETPAPTKAPETKPASTKAPETTPASTEAETEPGPFSDSAAFEGFDTYEYNGTAGIMDVTFGKTKFGDLNFTDIDKVKQFADDTNEAVKDPEKLGAGAFGEVISSWMTKTGGPLCYMVYNPSDQPAALDDCVLIGIMDYESVKFSNGIHYGSKVDEIKAILGEPNEIIKRSQWSFTFVWRDESGQHELTYTVYEPETVGEVDGLSYTNYTIAEK